MDSQIPRRRRRRITTPSLTTTTPSSITTPIVQHHQPTTPMVVVRPTRASVLRAQKNQRGGGSITSRPSQTAISCSSDSLYSSLRSIGSVQSARSTISARSMVVVSLPPSPPDLPPIRRQQQQQSSSKEGSPEFTDSPLLRDCGGGPSIIMSTSRRRTIPPPPSSALLRRYAAPAPFMKKTQSAGRTKRMDTFPNTGSAKCTPKHGWSRSPRRDSAESSPAVGSIAEEAKPSLILKRDFIEKALHYKQPNCIRLTKSEVALLCAGGYGSSRPLVKSKLVLFSGAPPKRVRLTRTTKGLAVYPPKVTRLVISNTLQQSTIYPKIRTLSSYTFDAISHPPITPRALKITEAVQVQIRTSSTDLLLCGSRFQVCQTTRIESPSTSVFIEKTIGESNESNEPNESNESNESEEPTDETNEVIVPSDRLNQAPLLNITKMEENYSLHFAKRVLGISNSDSTDIIPPPVFTIPRMVPSSNSYADILSPRVVEKVHLQGCNWLFARWAARAHSR